MNFNYQNGSYNDRTSNSFQNPQNTMMQNSGYYRGVYNQQTMPVMSPTVLGRIIQNPNEVKPNEVPMDGTCMFFPMYDGSAIYVKCWSPDGSSIITQRFISDGQNGTVPKTPEQLIMDRLDNLERLIKNRNGYQKFKKGGNVNERDDSSDDDKTNEQQPEHNKQPQK